MMTNGTARAGGPFRNRKMASLRFGLREIKEGEVVGRHRQRQRNLNLIAWLFGFADQRRLESSLKFRARVLREGQQKFWEGKKSLLN